MKSCKHEGNTPHNSLGYKVGRLVVKMRNRVTGWNARLVYLAYEKGFPLWVAKLPYIVFIIAVMGLFAASLFLLASALLILAIVGFSLIAIAKGMESDEIVELDSQVLEGYCDGPDGVGEYAGGERVDKD
ncbi:MULTISPECIES: DUF3742 family protein [Enterobacterales]|uniref:DUF3742 family protein n=1 Tax=Enterobacterales TaxID=91347 RepID=UPI000DCE0D34|nr:MULTISPECIES: DUF3742 family protein [Enterobacterales]HEN3291969.1 DUF3742 family protein [Yersinia enterocolitica]MCB5308803.1 DUF3742 family protein [Yersinia massiliensis]RAW71964.1 hypothetical protein CKY15_08560 [Photorhabdus sp. S7-51]RAW73559.1 hypothetical protein CKY14_07875 [Photorhabdus sp. S14-60]RAW78493.1 hypothetical protein CKY06_08055 [Photorhabdus sp. S15-56]